MAPLSVKHLLSVNDLTKQDIDWIFKKASELKKKPFNNLLKERSLIALFAKPSTRTRLSFVIGMTQLGGHAVYLNWNDLHLGRGETIQDTARVFSRYGDIVMARLFSHKDILDLAAASTIPVINGLTDLLHPCQALADLFTIKEHFGSLKGIRLAYVGDGNNNVTHSLMHACYKLGVQMSVGCPRQFSPNPQIVKETKNKIKITNNQNEAVKGADVVYTDTWVSMGKEKEAEQRIHLLKPYQVNSKLMSLAKKSAVFMHCLPAHREQEVTAEVIDGKQSIVFEQAENRLHVQKAILVGLLR